MALCDPIDTMAYQQSRLFTTHRDMSHVSCVNVSKRLGHYMETTPIKNTCPETEALWFYGMNHGVALISAEYAPLQPLSPADHSFVEDYHKRLGEKTLRAFYYLLLICTREFRHIHSYSTIKPKIEAQFGKNVAQFLGEGNGESEIHQNFIHKPPKGTIGDYVNALEYGFNNGQWSSSFGGKKWGAVTNCMRLFVEGTYTAEMMMDTVWTLAHNGGPIFNKGHLYKHYDAQLLLRVLDIQRSGQIPEGILHDKYLGDTSETDLTHLMHWLHKRFPNSFGKYVDWMKVKALGGLGNYSGEIKHQQQVHMMTPEQQAALAAAEAAAKAKAEAAKKQAEEQAKMKAEKEAKEKADFEKNHVEIMPDVFVKKFYPVRVAA